MSTSRPLALVAALAVCFVSGSALAQEKSVAPAPVQASPAVKVPADSDQTQSVPPDALAQQVGAEMDRNAASGLVPGSTSQLAPKATESMKKFIQGLVALFIVIALILFVYYAARRWGKRVPLLAGSNLGKQLGRLYLDRGTALHFVQVREKVLLIGVNANAISLLGEYAADTFDSKAVTRTTQSPGTLHFNPDSFLAELRARSQELSNPATLQRGEEDEIAALRGDIQRLQRYLREENREHED